MQVILNLTWAIALLPLVGVGVSFLAETPRRAAQVNVFFTALAFAVALVVLVFRLTHVIPVYENTQTFWDLQSTSASPTDNKLFPGEFLLLWGIRVDPLSVAFMASALFLSLTAQVHALGSLRGDPGFRRFFWVVALLTFGVLAMICSPNLFQFWLGWEVSGVAAWMLASHHWNRVGIGLLATRSFVLLRVADLTLLLGLVMTFAKFGIAVSRVTAPTGQTTADPFSFSVLTPEWALGHIGTVTGVGARTLVVLSVLFVVAALIRAAIGPLHVWLSGTLESPAPGVALVMLASLVPAGILVARVYPLLLEAPHMLTVLALTGAAGALVAAVLALAQRDLFRLGMFAVSSQAGVVLASFGMGGYSPALFVLFTASCLAVVYFLAADNLARAYRSRSITDVAGARRRMPRTTLVLGGWALGVSGLSLNTYSALSVTFRNALPVSGRVSSLTQALVAIALLGVAVLTSLFAFRVLFLVATGDPTRRRGFDNARLRDAAPQLRGAALLALAGAAAATVVGVPGVSTFSIGSRTVPGLTFSHFIFYGQFRQQLALDGVALLLAVLLGAGGAGAAWWLFSAQRRPATARLRRSFARAGDALAGPTVSERVAAEVPRGFVSAGEVLDAVDAQLLEPVIDSMGESVGWASRWMERLRTPRLGTSTAAAFAVVAILLAASILAVTGHFPVSLQ